MVVLGTGLSYTDGVYCSKNHCSTGSILIHVHGNKIYVGFVCIYIVSKQTFVIIISRYM